MQQLETYKLKHIDKDDPFSPDTLNANTDAVAGQLARLDAAIPRFAAGTYTGNGKETRVIDLGFTPKLVFVGTGTLGVTTVNGLNTLGGLAVTDCPAVVGVHTLVKTVENGFQVTHFTGPNSSYTSNTAGTIYRFFAIG